MTYLLLIFYLKDFLSHLELQSLCIVYYCCKKSCIQEDKIQNSMTSRDEWFLENKAQADSTNDVQYLSKGFYFSP